MLTHKIYRKAGDWKISSVCGKPAPPHLAELRIPPAWTGVQVETDPEQPVWAIGYDVKGRKQRLYSPRHMADAKSSKFERVRALLEEWPSIKEHILADLQDPNVSTVTKEAAYVAWLTYNTGIRPGSNADTLASVRAFGATTLQVRHVKLVKRGVRLKFIGKKGVPQNIPVTDPILVALFSSRKHEWQPYRPLFKCSGSSLRNYFKELGTGQFSPKDFRTACGTLLAIKLIGNRQRLPKAIARRKKLLNNALDRVSKMLGNTRAIARNSYVDPAVLDRILSTLPQPKPKKVKA